MNQEYEYSFKVKDITPFIDYCQQHQYQLIEDYRQIRTLYKNNGTVMARITKNFYPNQTIEILNFKDDHLTEQVLKVNRETADLIITEENRPFVNSLIEILDLNHPKILERHRLVYQKNQVKFEIDDYTTPTIKVVAIEGLKEEVDAVYQELECFSDLFQN